VRRPWKKVLGTIAKQLPDGDSFSAERYLAIIRFLQNNS
jgi:hypothetical protein